MRVSIPLSLLCLSGMTGLAALPAQAELTYANQSGGSATFYGQFDPSWTRFDDGADSQGKIADNSKSNSRVGFTLTQPFAAFELGFKFETALGFRQSGSISQLDAPDSIDWDRQKLRHVDLSLKTPRYGTFYLGQGSMGSDSIGDRSFSPTTLVNDVSIGDIAGSYFLRQDDGVLSDVTVGDAFANFNGNRRGRIRYDSPDFGGFVFRTSYGRNILVHEDDDEYWDAALSYDRELPNGTEISAGLGYYVRDRSDGQDDIKDTFASAAVRLPSGVNAAMSIGSRDNGGSYYFGQLGYSTDGWVSWGATSLAVDYYKGKDMVSDGDSAQSWSIGLVQSVASISTDIYAGYRSYDYDDDTTSYRKADSVMIGARWKF